MKDYEKRYKKALEAVKELQKANPSDEGIQNWVDDNFPELIESEDERIRKEIIHFLEVESGQMTPEQFFKSEDEWIPWLEKQGEQKPFDYENANIQQKDFAPKVEPKFKVGDYIKHNKANIIRKVVSVNSGSYYVENIETNGGIELFNAEQNFHLWTIQDAKEGDVLVVPPVKGSEHSEQIFIFKEIKDREYVKNAVEYYCRCMDNKFAANECGFMGQSDDYLTPATKEQRDLLFQKMKEAGYEWDYNKKGLRKIEKQKPIEWNEEDEEMLQALVSGIGCYTYFSGIQSEDIVNWLKSLKQRFKEE